MELAVISPVQHLKDFSVKGSFDFALCHVLKEERLLGKETVYRDYFRSQSLAGRTVFLDNGAHENSCVDVFTLCACANDIRATHVIAPDKVGDYEETYRLTEEFLSFLQTQDLDFKFQVIGVAQGSTFQEWMDCYEYLLTNPMIDVIAIPYDVNFLVPVTKNKLYTRSLFTKDILYKECTKSVTQCYTRMELVKKLQLLNLLKKPIHLLGWSLPYEIFYYKQEDFEFFVPFSNDSQGYCVYPEILKEAPSLLELEENLVDKIRTPEDFWREIPREFHSLIDDFIEDIKSVMNEEE